MMRIELDELRSDLQRHIDAVRGGETAIVTEGGVPVARIVPVDHVSPLDRLVADGVIQMPTAPKQLSTEPITPADATLRLSEQVIADRD